MSLQEPKFIYSSTAFLNDACVLLIEYKAGVIVGKALLTSLEHISARKGCKQIQFITKEYRLDTLRFCESIGYSSTALYRFQYENLYLWYLRTRKYVDVQQE